MYIQQLAEDALDLASNVVHRTGHIHIMSQLYTVVGNGVAESRSNLLDTLLPLNALETLLLVSGGPDMSTVLSGVQPDLTELTPFRCRLVCSNYLTCSSK